MSGVDEGKRGEECGVDLLRADARRNVRSILEAAARVLADDPAASMGAIAAVAEVSRPTVYRHFANRDELFEAIRLEATTQVMEALEAAATSAGTAVTALELLILDLAGIAARYPLLLNLVGVRAGPQPGKRPAEAARAFEALIARGERDGTLRRGLRAETLEAVTMGSLLLALKLGRESGSEPAEIGADVAATVLDGARAPVGDG